jgi:hypothetical protein
MERAWRAEPGPLALLRPHQTPNRKPEWFFFVTLLKLWFNSITQHKRKEVVNMIRKLLVSLDYVS